MGHLYTLLSKGRVSNALALLLVLERIGFSATGLDARPTSYATTRLDRNDSIC